MHQPLLSRAEGNLLPSKMFQVMLVCAFPLPTIVMRTHSFLSPINHDGPYSGLAYQPAALLTSSWSFPCPARWREWYLLVWLNLNVPTSRFWSSLSHGFHAVLMHEPTYPIPHLRVLMKEFLISVQKSIFIHWLHGKTSFLPVFSTSSHELQEPGDQMYCIHPLTSPAATTGKVPNKCF